MDRPEHYMEEHGDFLDVLRDSNATNMMGAGPYLQDEFDLSPSEARQVLLYWMSSKTQ